MLKERARVIDLCLRAFDLAVLAAGFPIAHLIAYTARGRVLGETMGWLEWRVLVLTMPLWVGSAWFFDLYQAYRTRPLRVELARLARALALVAATLAMIGFFSKHEGMSRLFVALYFAMSLALLAGHRVLIRHAARAVRRRGYNTRVFAVVGSGEAARDVVESMTEHREWGCHFAGYVLEDGSPDASDGAPVLGRLGELGTILDTNVLDEVVFATGREHLDAIERAVLLCEEQGVGAKICLNFFPRRIAKTSIEELGHMPVLAFSTIPAGGLALFAKRAFDVVASAVAILLLSPLFLGAALAIRLESRGPILFRQRRVGVNGREFTLLKFRSMHVDAEARLAELRRLNEAEGPVFKMRDDPRVTSVGRVLRRTSIDELPQLFNVLRGEMSIVGPRPPIMSEVRQYKRWQRRRLSIKPGITCTWQVSGRSDIGFDRWMELDLSYIDNWSLWSDVLICFKTIPAVFSGRGAR